MNIENLKQLIKNQIIVVSGEEECCDQLCQKQRKGLDEEGQWNDQHQAK